MSIFNSLGSNYSGRFVISNLFSFPSARAKRQLADELGEYYEGQANLTFKGREALELGFRRCGLPQDSKVGISGFSCYVVYQAIVNAGYQPVFIDTAPGDIQFGLTELQLAVKRQPQLKAVVVQNTLGWPADMPSIERFCREQQILVVEDLAHSLGAIYDDGREAGKVGDFVMLSFSQDKPLDAVAGGALIDKQTRPFSARPVSLWQRLKIRLYPFNTAIIRSTYRIGLGRLIHYILKKMHLLATPMSDAITGLHSMSSASARLVLNNWHLRQQELEHRQNIAKIYNEKLAKDIQIKTSGQPSYLRFPIIVKNRQGLIDYLKKAGIYVGDTWYDAPVAPKRYLSQTSYQAGDCPQAEQLATSIVNLPTHRHVSSAEATNICERISQWQTSQSMN